MYFWRRRLFDLFI